MAREAEALERRPCAPAANVVFPRRWVERYGEAPANPEAREAWININVRADATEKR